MSKLENLLNDLEESWLIFSSTGNIGDYSFLKKALEELDNYLLDYQNELGR